MEAAGWLHGSRSLSADFHLGALPSFQAEIAWLGPAARNEGEGLVAFRFQKLTAGALGTLSAFLCEHHASHSSRLERLFSSRDHTIELDASAEDPTSTTKGNMSILALLRHCLEEEAAPLLLHQDVPPAAVRLGDVKIDVRDGNWSLLAMIPVGSDIEVDEATEQVFYLPGSLAVTWFRATVRKVVPCQLAINAPPLVFQTGFRCSRRVATPWSQPAVVTIEEPHPYGERINREVLEVAGGGFSIAFDPAHDLLSPGQQLRHVRVALPTGSVEMECVFRMCRPGQEGEHMIAGFEVVGFRSPEDHDRWMRSMIPCVFPETRLGDEQMVAAAWGRLEQSGYLDMIEQSERVRLRAPFFADWTRHADHSGFHARFFLGYHEEEPVGIAAANLIYPKTCMVHSVGIDKGAQGVGRVLKLASASFLYAHTVAEYSLTLLEAHKPINDVLIKGFVERYTGQQDNFLDAYTVYKWHAGRARQLPEATSEGTTIEVVGATSDLLRVLWEHQRKTLGALELDAYGWSPDERTMKQFTESCAYNGYERSRHVFFAMSRDQPIAALIAETGSEGMNVFSLLNSCTVVMLEDNQGHRGDVLMPLLARAIDLYSGAGKGAFLFLGTTGVECQARIQELGFSYVAEGWRWLAARRVIPAYLGYLQDMSSVGASRRGGAGRRPPWKGHNEHEQKN